MYQAILILMGMRHVEALQATDICEAVRPQTERLNASLCQHAQQGKDIEFLASPITGGGIAVPRSDQLFLESIAAGGQTPAEWAQHAWQQFSAHKQKIVTEAGQRLEKEEDALAELQARASRFADKQLPILKALGIARIARIA